MLFPQIMKVLVCNTKFKTIGRPVITNNLEPMISIAGEELFVNPKNKISKQLANY